ncbi:diguanylate cyclase [Rhizobium leguminosarum bv. trifolii CB782]|uniref:diguanylate cyclase n=1 Tax=Rhizobium hidalgonense TaxID=1538159 RepID=A0A2A6KG42_9HYPH|nr:GGDEF domain-containing protein [Rhizobium hidalgonense]AHG46574.1 diguanylate cyclase [Rhizobium leguminosarum bv. trifolii CB782]EJC77503.1 diguanylate cyclase (GGDEF) domain-containing protein [Rhizobium leguminosarum bv. trifolii WSM2012]MDR9773610.1 GGDEF domain-containing protein [Rhizobium hidalgonense]MDR9807346.1 GGDEF domain-containing protein [Rhizobium hidalgonense]MDR9819369.1 GGDEF domain-containing protein [Rhizobium hidalgonense]
MRSWMSLQADFGNFQYRRNVYLFALKMSFLAVLFSGVIMALTIPPLGFFGLLPVTLAHAIGFGAIFSWLVGGTVSGMLSLAAGFALHELTLSRAEFEKLSRTDTLSGLLNRRAFAEALENTEGNASLVIFDVDRFKAINDRFGHACGDAVITAVSAMLTSAFDEMSVVARLGGEEFGVIISGEPLEARMERIEAVRARIASGAIAAEEHDIRITVSGGVADLAAGRGKQAVYASADRALYLAKALGRNRVVHEREGLHHAWHGLVDNGLDAKGRGVESDNVMQAYGI